MNFGVFNRAFAVTNEENWFQILPKGEHPGTLIEKGVPGRQITQVVDQESLEMIMAAINTAQQDQNWPGILVDLEHFSSSHDHKSEAAAWVRNFDVREDGLWGKFELTDLGEQVINTGRYRMLSPDVRLVPITSDRMRVNQIATIGLTNRPNLKGMVPLSNRELNTENSDNGGRSMKEVYKLLGLADNAEETSVVEAIQKAMNRAETAENDLKQVCNRVKELESAQLKAEAAEFVEQHAAVIHNRETVIEQYVANKDATVALFAGLKNEPAKQIKVLNRTDAKAPTGENELAVLNRDRDAFIKQVKVTNGLESESAAYTLASTLKPELFGR